MKAIIVQAGGGYYGVNMRLVNDDVGTKVGADLVAKVTKGKASRNDDGSFTMEVKTPDGTDDAAMVWIYEVEDGKSIGFDSGMWDAAEELINRLVG